MTKSGNLITLYDSQALYKEQVENFGTGIEGQFRTMTYDEMRDLPILDAVIRETLRMHPPIHSIIRKVVSDTPVPPTLASSASSASASRKNDENAYFVPKGYYAVSSPAVSQVDPLVWKEARKWDPKRWLEKDGVADRAGRTYDDADGERVDYGFGAVSKGTESPYQPFGAGRHRCIGEQVSFDLFERHNKGICKIDVWGFFSYKFAYLQLGMVISTLIRNMELRLDIPFPPNNYHVREFLALSSFKCVLLTRLIVYDYSSARSLQHKLQTQNIQLMPNPLHIYLLIRFRG